MTITEILEQLAKGEALSDRQADMAFGMLMDGELDSAAAGAFLMGLRAKGEDSTDLASGVRAGLNHARTIPGYTDGSAGVPVIDTCGTGGDGSLSFNCSTAVALFLADMGHKVAKHGNRSVSSSCGSADVLEELGVPLMQAPEDAAKSLNENNFAFLFAPNYHPAFKYVMPVRQALGIRTLFNLMGPLLNPARPSHQLLGVGDPSKLQIMGETLLLTGVDRAMVIAGAGGFDEVTTFGPARGYLLHDGIMEKTTVNPDRLGFPAYSPDDVRVRDKDHAVAVMRDILDGTGPQAMMDMVAVNLAVCLHLLEQEPLRECADKARDAVSQGLTKGLPHAG
ncbi:anthranilate phosphoribosyltransferase [Pseudodesulfovibrio senegalensis]|uniref:Anthranilate phosphoribosyltransferase n=1 Tax=Pseudodesulfovibrio senegalensis TaxID=1721087 RepID=A0A6N6N0D0_9BACT|nr:anthranilate phosphoribosyltransferase [Pseudodesulfovibrio senegalensis]KAB1438792.1 anthranilate phosphoribosyltransferase [Pseudodesulfovibrio senegalensis]